MDFTERFELYKEGGMITDADIEDIKAVIALFKDKYGVTLEEENAGNGEFRTAKKTIQDSVDEMAAQMPEVRDFCRDFLPAYGSTLDELL